MTAILVPPTRSRTSSKCVYKADDGALTSTRLLRMFEEARRDLSLQLTDSEGSGAGYDGLRIERDAIAAVEPGDVITVTALVGTSRPRVHLVDYMATVSREGHQGAQLLLAQAHGYSLATGDVRH
jgi:hypothetical protein